MKISLAVAALILSSGLTACSKSDTPPARGSEPAPPPVEGRFIGKMWISSTPGAARGSFMIFLPDHTLLMGSCVETYRLSQWGVADDKIRWIEDTIPIEASVLLHQRNQMLLRIAGQDRDQTFVLASAPYVCPDMPR